MIISITNKIKNAIINYIFSVKERTVSTIISDLIDSSAHLSPCSIDDPHGNLKFIKNIDLSSSGICVLSDRGFIPIKQIMQTIMYEKYIVKLEGGYDISCADEHILIDETFSELYVRDLKVGDKIQTIHGARAVESITATNQWEHMYDLELPYHHLFYTNGILSHNSICVAAIMMYYCIFNKNKTLGIISLKKAGAVEILDRIKTIYLNLPMWLKPAVTKWNNGSIEFANGCKIIASATTGASIRGKSLAFLYIDEICFIPRKLWDSFYKSTFPVISASKLAKIVITTTPNGKDHFYYMWQDAIKKRNDYVTQKVIWTDVPGRDEAWRLGALADVGNDENAFRQEYEVEFLGASLEYIKLKTLEQVESTIKSPLYNDKDTTLNVFEHPINNHDYCISVDVSEGKGKDYNTAVVIDVSQMPLKVVATLKNNQIDSIEFAPILYQLGMKYNEAFLMIENNLSDLAKDMWYNYEYVNMLNFNLSKSEFRQPKKIEVGLKTTSKVRKIGEEYFKHMVENDKIILNDIRLIKELNNLEYNEMKKRFVPRDENINDDLWSAMKTFSYIAKTYYFEAMLKNGKALNGLLQSSRKDEDEPLPFIIKPFVMTTVTDETAKKKSKVIDRAERRWRNAQSWI